jgi:hypothetical protein
VYLENFIEGRDDLKFIEKELQDYDDLPQLVDIISNIFTILTTKIDGKLA